MTNRVDFYQAEKQELTMPAGGAFVFIEGRLCANLEVVEIVKGRMGKYDSARMAWQPNNARTDDEIEIGKEISIKWIYNSLYPGGGADGLVIFAGQVEKVETDGENIEVVARDFSSTLERITVFGRRVRDIDGRIIFTESAETIFNESGEPNASIEKVEHNGNRIQVFTVGTEGKFWDCADVIRYLLCEYVPAGQLAVPEQERLREIADGAELRGLDVNGLSLLEAIEQCCEPAGMKFKFVPRLSETGPKRAIVFYRNQTGRSIELNLQQAGERLSVSRTNIWKAGSERFSPVTHRYAGLGDYKVYEATFDLIKGWPWYDEDLDYEKFSPSTNPDFYKVKDTWRKWCLNEAGDYTDAPFTQGLMFDFSPVFGTDNYVHHRRRFWPALSCDVQGRSMGYFLEVSYDSGNHWWQYLGAFENLLDECGIWLASDRLDMRTWFAAIKGALRFRITAAVVADERLSCVATDGPVGSAVPVVERIINTGKRFKFRKVTGESIFAGLAGNVIDGEQDITLGKPNEADDTTALYQFVRQLAKTNQSAIEIFDVRTPYLAIGFEVGDKVVSNPDTTDVFSTTSDNRSTAVIESVRMDFLKQSTELKVVRRRNL